MDKMRQEVKEKLTYWSRLCALFVVLLSTNCVNYFRPRNSGDNYTDFFQGFQMGIAAGLLLWAIVQIMRYRKILQDEEAVRAFYIREHDERAAAIWSRSGGTVLYTCALLIIGASLVAGYYNPAVFITLLFCGLFLLLVKKGLILYYRRTM